METTAIRQAAGSDLTDNEVVDRVKAGDTALYEILMRRYNQRLHRVARAILRDDAESEDVMQDAYVRAYEHLDQFAGRSLVFHVAHPHRRSRSPGTSPPAHPQSAIRRHRP